MSERPYAKIQITEKGERALRGRHPWVYSDEVTDLVGEIQNGDIVDVQVLSVDPAKKRISLTMKIRDAQ